MTYFSGITTKAGATRRYRTLVKKLHPDVPGGDKSAFQDMAAEYNALTARLEREELARARAAAQQQHDARMYNYAQEHDMNAHTRTEPQTDIAPASAPATLLKKIGKAVKNIAGKSELKFEVNSDGFNFNIKSR